MINKHLLRKIVGAFIMQKFKEMINLEELLEAIENYKSLVELNMPKGYTLEGLPITERLNQQIENAKKQLKN